MMQLHQPLLLSSYHHLVWLVLIGNNSKLNSFYSPSKLTMKSKHALAKKMLEEVKKIA